MRIAIDGRPLTGRFTGDRTYWRNLLRSLLRIDTENEYRVYTRLPLPEGELPAATNLICTQVSAASDRLWTLVALPHILRQDHADLLHVQYTTPPRLFCPCPMVTTVHDISFRLYPQWFPLKHRLLLDLTVPVSMKAAARVITDAESSLYEMRRVYGIPAEKIVAISLGLPDEYVAEAHPSGISAERRAAEKESDLLFAKEQFKLDAPFVMAVGVMQPRKNLPLLAEAFGKAKAKYRLPHLLAIVGKAGWGSGQEALLAAAECGGGREARESVVFTGYVEDADLPRLYRACAAFAYPSLYEGFGFPPLEAMACSAPVLVSDAPPMPEIAGDAALIVSATDTEAWCEALHRVLTEEDLRLRLSAAGPPRAAGFSWENTARRTLEVYRQAVGQR